MNETLIEKMTQFSSKNPVSAYFDGFRNIIEIHYHWTFQGNQWRAIWTHATDWGYGLTDKVIAYIDNAVDIINVAHEK